MTRRAGLALLTACSLTIAACGSADDVAAPEEGGSLDVVVGFYPLEYLTDRVGGERVTVTNLTRAGTDPHDAELSARDVATVSDADLAVYESGLQPAVDEAVTSQDVAHRLDVAQAAELTQVVDQPIIDVAAGGHDDHTHEDHAHEDGSHDHADETDGHGHDHAGEVDPHFWLDPVRYEQVATSIAASLSEIDPDGADTYEANLAQVRTDLQALHGEFEAGLASCRSTTLVTSHAAFGYLAQRYGFEQAAISGLTPDAEPDPRRLAQVADYARERDVTTIYAETLSSPAIAETVARETGATTKVLDPIEGITTEGTDYLSIMRSNLETLRDGQGCS
ncbi:MAG: zinc ABC transporter substrate-binding protein [Mobilicoccus sp.]|nr:zinc ABC transporter substrate-binding protein [Mobilicoccus sp.]